MQFLAVQTKKYNIISSFFSTVSGIKITEWTQHKPIFKIVKVSDVPATINKSTYVSAAQNYY